MNNKRNKIFLKGQNSTLLLWIFILIYLFYFGLAGLMKFNSFGYYDFDLAVHDLSMWNILHGSIFNSILGISFLGNHMHVILFLIAPLYAVFNHPFTLLLLQTTALGITAFPLYKLACRLLDENWALIISILYLFYPALGYTNLFEFHPTVFATLFLFLAFYYYQLNSFVKSLIFMVLSMLCQENIPFAIIMFGILAIFNRRTLKWIATPIFIGSLYLLIALLLISYFNNGVIQFISIYRHLGNTPLEIVLNILSNPFLLFKTLIRRECFIYLLHIFLPLSFVPLLSPVTLIPALPFFLQHLLSNRFSEFTIFYHYTAEMIPFIFISFIYGIKSLLKNRWLKTNSRSLRISIVFVLFITNAYLGPHFKILPHLLYEFRKDYLDVYKDKFISKIPEQSSVIATFEFLPHLSHRNNLYSLHHVYMGYHTLSDKEYKLPNDVEYALIDFNDFLTFTEFYSPNNYKNIQRFLFQGNWQIEDFIDTIVLFKKNIPGEELCQKIQGTKEIENKMSINIEGDIELMGYSLGSHSKADILDIVLYWRCLRLTERDINIILDIVDVDDRVILRKIRPICYRIFPTNSWQEEQIFKEKCRIKIPFVSSKENYKLKMGFFDYRNGLPCKINGNVDSLGRVSLMAIR